jgi:eukaryotic-like serine/threonine-protein kinase
MSLPLQPRPNPAPGEVLAGKYRIESVIGSGGMGVVLAAQHELLRQRVAIKMLLPEAATQPGAAERFLREARSAASITSEYVVRVLDVGTLEDGAPFLVMEYLAGKTLSKLLRERKRIPLVEAADLLLQAAEALAEAHASGIVHRDLKPANLFLASRPGGDARLKVLDFGLSKVLVDESGNDASITSTDFVAGSPAYMSPEQVRSLKNVDERTDVWALGVILFELLAGERPFDARTMAAAVASVVADAPKSLADRVPMVPPEVEELVYACLEKDPANRLPDVGVFARRLAPFGTSDARLRLARIIQLAPEAAAASRASRVSLAAERASAEALPPLPSDPQGSARDALGSEASSIPGPWTGPRGARPQASDPPPRSAPSAFGPSARSVGPAVGPSQPPSAILAESAAPAPAAAAAAPTANAAPRAPSPRALVAVTVLMLGATAGVATWALRRSPSPPPVEVAKPEVQPPNREEPTGISPPTLAPASPAQPVDDRATDPRSRSVDAVSTPAPLASASSVPSSTSRSPRAASAPRERPVSRDVRPPPAAAPEAPRPPRPPAATESPQNPLDRSD